jgi:hypothetical protein
MLKRSLAVLFVLAASVLTAPAQSPGKPAVPGIEVRISFTVEEYDPKAPKGSLLLIVRNDTKEAVNVPADYDGRTVVIKSGLLTLHRHGKPVEKAPKRVRIEPGKEQIVLELPLDQILKGVRKPGDLWGWDWPRRAAPPPSPIQLHWNAVYREQAAFTADVEVNGQKLTSKAAVLKVKTTRG